MAFEDVDGSSSNTGFGASLDIDNQLADILMGEDSSKEEDESQKQEGTTSELESEEQDSGDSQEDESQAEEESNQEEEETTDEEGDEQTWESLLGVPEEQLEFDEDGNLAGVKTKVNGESATVKINELVTGYQNNKVFTQKSQALAEERKTFDTEKTQFTEAYKSKLENADSLVNLLGQQLVAEFEGINWETLRTENPAEYAALRQDYASRAQQVQQAQSAINQERDESLQKQQEQNIAKRNEVVKEQFEIMLRNNPVWADDATRQKDMNAMDDFMAQQYGFDKGSIQTIIDARIMEVIKDAKAYRAMKDVSTKKVPKKVPKFNKSVGKPKKKVSKFDKLAKRAKTARPSNQRAAQTDAIAQLLLE